MKVRALEVRGISSGNSMQLETLEHVTSSCILELFVRFRSMDGCVRENFTSEAITLDGLQARVEFYSAAWVDLLFTATSTEYLIRKIKSSSTRAHSVPPSRTLNLN